MEISNCIRGYILDLRAQRLGARRISRILEARNREKLKVEITISEKAIGNMLRKWKRNSTA